MNYLEKRKANYLIFLCWLVYTAAYIGRLNYNANLVMVISSLSVSKLEAGMVSSCFFLAYGSGQFVNGILSKRYNSKIMIFISLISAALLNILMPFCNNINLMKIIWFLNGAVQSILWSTIIKTLGKYLPKESINKAILIMSSTVAIGTFTTYGLSALMIALGVWKIVFYISGILLVAVSVVWFTGLKRLQKSILVSTRKEQIYTDTPLKQINYTPILIINMIVIIISAVANGFIKDGTVTWVPVILYEDFGLDKSLSVVLTLMLPLLSIAGASIAALFKKKIKSYVLVNAVFFVIAAVNFSGILLILQYKLVSVTMIFFISIACCMAAINNILTSAIPLSCREHINSGLIAGLINCCCYIGSTLSIVLLGSVADNSGWEKVFILLCIISGVTAVVSLAFAFIERKKYY